jgi:hypothetical protein
MTDDWKLPWSGGCRCDRVRFQITAPPIGTMACHCRGCQRMSASAFSLSVLIPSAGFTVTGDVVVGGIHGPTAKHYHCDYCKGWMFTRPTGMDQFVNVRATLLDDASWFVPFVETATSEGLPWAKTGAKHSFPNIPGPEAFGPIVEDFAKHAARPR